MASKNIRDQKSAANKPAKKGGEIKDSDLDKVAGGMSTAGLPTGKRLTSADPCEGGR